MKKTLFLITSLILLSNHLFSKEFDYNSIICMEIIEQNDAATIIEMEDANGVILYRVISGIITAFLPEIINEICMRSVGDPLVCDAVYDVTCALVKTRKIGSFLGKTSRYKKSLKWRVDRRNSKDRSYAEIETNSERIAQAIKLVFGEYRRMCDDGNGIPWESIDLNSVDVLTGREYYTFKIKNESNVDFYVTTSFTGYRLNGVKYLVKKGTESEVRFCATSSSYKTGAIFFRPQGGTTEWMWGNCENNYTISGNSYSFDVDGKRRW